MLGLLGAATAFFYGGIIGVGQGYRAGGLANRWVGGVVMVASRLASRPSGRPVGPMGGRQAGGGWLCLDFIQAWPLPACCWLQHGPSRYRYRCRRYS